MVPRFDNKLGPFWEIIKKQVFPQKWHKTKKKPPAGKLATEVRSGDAPKPSFSTKSIEKSTKSGNQPLNRQKKKTLFPSLKNDPSRTGRHGHSRLGSVKFHKWHLIRSFFQHLLRLSHTWDYSKLLNDPSGLNSNPSEGLWPKLTTSYDSSNNLLPKWQNNYISWARTRNKNKNAPARNKPQQTPLGRNPIHGEFEGRSPS